MASQDKLDITTSVNYQGDVITEVQSGATISRKKLIKIAFQTLDEYPALSDDDRNHLLYVACTMKRVALAAWAVDPTCGCLVGTLLLNETPENEIYAVVDDMEDDMGRVLKKRERDTDLLSVGSRFDDILRDYMVEKYELPEKTYFASQSVRVKD